MPAGRSRAHPLESGTRHLDVPPGLLARPTGAKRGAEPFPCSLAPQRRSPVARLSPGFVRRRRRTRRVRRLTLTKPYRGVLAPPNDVRCARCVATHRPLRRRASSPSAPRTGRLSRHYSPWSEATLPHPGALRHEPVMRRIAPEHRPTHGVAAPVTNFRLREISDRGRPRSRPPAPAPAPRRRRRSAAGTPSPGRRRAVGPKAPARAPPTAPSTTCLTRARIPALRSLSARNKRPCNRRIVAHRDAPHAHDFHERTFRP